MIPQPPMSALQNLTPFAAACIPSMSRDDELLTLVVVAGRFLLPQPGTTRVEAPRIADEQPPVRFEDEYHGDPASSSLRHEGQSTYFRPGTDLYVVGHAWSPGGRAASQGAVAVRVGQYQKAAAVFGDRVWSPGVVSMSPTRPLPFTSIPLTYERCFGGFPSNPSRAIAEAADRNPVGRGLFASEREATGQPLPNFEDPTALIQGLSDRPHPCGFGPIARHWAPRRSFGGTYDQAWIEERMPLWPRDFDERFFCAASPGLCATPHLRGGEPVQLVGMSPDGAYDFSLPVVRLRARFELASSSIRRPLILDAVSFEPEDGSFTLVWRAFLVADPLTVGAVVVRPLEHWEVAQ